VNILRGPGIAGPRRVLDISSSYAGYDIRQCKKNTGYFPEFDARSFFDQVFIGNIQRPNARIPCLKNCYRR